MTGSGAVTHFSVFLMDTVFSSGVRGDYYLRMKFCSDKNGPRGMLKESAGIANSFFMINDAVKTGMSN